MAQLVGQKTMENSRVGLDKFESFKKTKLGKNLPGILLVFIIAFIANSIGKEMPLIGATVFSIVLGILLRNFTTVPVTFDSGIQYSLKIVLKYSIVLLGSSLNLWEVMKIGSSALIPIIAVVILGICVTKYVGKWMGLDGNIPTLIGVGTAICGATAIATISPIMKAKEEETAFAITTIFIFNVMAVVVYPLLGNLFGMSSQVFGMWAGTAIHDTSSVVAAGYAFGNQSGEVATVVKLTRTLFLVPLALFFSFYIGIKSNSSKGSSKVKISKIFPWFLLGFIGMSVLNTIGFLPEVVTKMLTSISKFMILMSMASVGLGASFAKIKQLGMKPIYIGLFASVLVAVISISLIYLVI